MVPLVTSRPRVPDLWCCSWHGAATQLRLKYATQSFLFGGPPRAPLHDDRDAADQASEAGRFKVTALIPAPTPAPGSPIRGGAVAKVSGEGFIKRTRREYRQNQVVSLRAADGKIAFLREYFDPVRAARALGTPIPGLES